MTNKPILTKDQFARKVEEFNNIPMENRVVGMTLSLDCEHSKELLDYAWKYTKEVAEKVGKTNIEHIFIRFHDSVIKTILETAGVPQVVIPSISRVLAMNKVMRGILWHMFTEIAPEEDVVLLTGNFDIHSEVSDD